MIRAAFLLACTAAVLIGGAHANAEPGAYSDQDARFYRLITSPAAGMVVTNFPLVRVVAVFR